MIHRRVGHNSVILPTGEILVVGGVDETCESVLQAEGFRPPEIFGGPPGGEWKVRASHLHARTYHSVAGLLPDGRVFSAGGNASGHTYHSAEIFSPSYYFSSTRPAITSWPKPTTDTWVYNEQAAVGVTLSCTASNSVMRVVLISAASVTHGFDMNQRYVQLGFVQSGTYPDVSLSVTGPRDGYAAPPGLYMLFVIDFNGHPSEGRWVRIGDM
jgi:hypothetical protein